MWVENIRTAGVSANGPKTADVRLATVASGSGRATWAADGSHGIVDKGLFLSGSRRVRGGVSCRS